MTFAIGGAQRDVRPWQCIPLPSGNDCAHTALFPRCHGGRLTTKRRQPLSTSVQLAKWIAGKRKQQRSGHLLVLFLCGWVIEPVSEVTNR